MPGERAKVDRCWQVRMVLDHGRDHPSHWAAVSIAEKSGCAPQTLHDRVKKADIADKVKALERESQGTLLV